MMTLADTTSLLEQTTDLVSGQTESLTPQTGINLIDQWLEPLRAAQNTKPIADSLTQLKKQLQAESVNEDAIKATLGDLADKVSALSPETGSEGEMPSLLEGLSAALRQAGDTSITD